MDTSSQKHPLAFDLDGNPIEIPDGAAAWRVRKGGGRRGRPRPVFDPETGRQLEVDLDGSIEDLIEGGCKPGRYRLELVDVEGRIMSEVPAAILEIPGETGDEEEAVKKPTLPAAPPIDTDRQLILELVRANCSVMLGMATAFGQVQPIHPQPVVVQAPPAEAPSGGGTDLATLLAPLLAPDKLMPLLSMIGTGVAGAVKSIGNAAAPAGGVQP